MLKLILGPMFSGKTDRVIREGSRYRAIGKTVLFVDHVSDVRYSTTHVMSHDGRGEQCVFVDKLSELLDMDLYDEADVVIIEEAQFYSDLLEFVTRESDKSNKILIVAGLAGDFERKPIGHVLDLIPFAEHVEKLNGFCNGCKDGTSGAFTRRISDDVSQLVVGGKNKYDSVCRKCFLNKKST